MGSEDRKKYMIISHKHKFIFLHTPKAAGSSISVSLCRYLDPDDIMLGSTMDCLSFNIKPPRRMVRQAVFCPSIQTGIATLIRARSFWQFVSSSNKKHYKRILGAHPEHADIASIGQAFPGIWHDYEKLVVTRNPWDRIASEYFWRVRNLKRAPAFTDYLRLVAGEIDELHGLDRLPLGWDYVHHEAYGSVDYVIRFDCLHSHLGQALRQIGVPWDGWLPSVKRRNNCSVTDKYTNSIYCRSDVEKVFKLCRSEIETYGYSFEGLL